jgi:hypothetical protein
MIGGPNPHLNPLTHARVGTLTVPQTQWVQRHKTCPEWTLNLNLRTYTRHPTLQTSHNPGQYGVTQSGTISGPDYNRSQSRLKYCAPQYRTIIHAEHNVAQSGTTCPKHNPRILSITQPPVTSYTL